MHTGTGLSYYEEYIYYLYLYSPLFTEWSHGAAYKNITIATVQSGICQDMNHLAKLFSNRSLRGNIMTFTIRKQSTI